MTPSIRSSIAVLVAVWLVAGCSAGSSASTSPSGASGGSLAGASGTLEPASSQPSVEPTSSAAPGELPASILDPVLADIARLAAVPLNQVTVLSAQTVTFPDGSLGCPVPGFAYTQVQTDGYRIVAGAAGSTYDYRGTGAGKFRLCTPKK